MINLTTKNLTVNNHCFIRNSIKTHTKSLCIFNYFNNLSLYYVTINLDYISIKIYGEFCEKCV